MGDRGQVQITYRGGASVYLYTHWGAEELPLTVAMALDRGRARWDDPDYLARIIFSEMTLGEELAETGYGISPYSFDEAWRTVLVDTVAKTVTYTDVSGEDTDAVPYEKYIRMLAWA